MKTIVFVLSIVSAIFAGTSCDGSKPEIPPTPDPPSLPEISNYVTSVEITNKESATVSVDNDRKIIQVALTKNAGKGNVSIKLNLTNGVKMYFPKQLEYDYDLTSGTQDIWLDYNNKQVKYSIRLEEKEVAEIDPVSLGWTDVSTDYGELPAGIKVYKSPTQLEGRAAKAFIAIADVRNSSKFRVLSSSPAKTPSNYYAQHKFPIIINAGYMYNATNICLLVQNGLFVNGNAGTSNRKNSKGETALFYTTRGAFGLMKDGAFRTEWTYSFNSKTYAYPAPLQNKEGGDPLPPPSSTYPTGAWELEMLDAIGSGPVLVRRGRIENTWDYEFWDDTGGTLPNGPVQRTAVGVTENQKLIFFVCEGRNVTPGIPGFTTAEVAAIMSNLGCVEALNLDGGGSTCMLVNGQNTVIPNGGASEQRVAATALAISNY